MTHKMFQISEKPIYREHIAYVLMSRAGPKVQKPQGRRLQFSALELFKNRRKTPWENDTWFFIEEVLRTGRAIILQEPCGKNFLFG